MTSLDLIIVGSGPGGSTAAEVLTAAGWNCVMLERGPNRLVDAEPPYDVKGDFSNDELKFKHRYFLGPDPLVEPRTFRKTGSAADHDYVGPVNDLPATVGGGGVHADGKLPRFRPEDIQCLCDLARGRLIRGEVGPATRALERAIHRADGELRAELEGCLARLRASK